MAHNTKCRKNIDYQSNKQIQPQIKAYLNTYDYEKMFFQLDDNLVQIRRLKEKNILNLIKQKKGL